MALSKPHAEILDLHQVQKLSYREIAGHLGISLGTVKSRLNRARLAHKIENDRHPNGNPKWDSLGRELDVCGGVIAPVVPQPNLPEAP